MPFSSDEHTKLTPKTTRKHQVKNLWDRLGFFRHNKTEIPNPIDQTEVSAKPKAPYLPEVPAIISGRKYSFSELVNLDSTLRHGKQTADTVDTLTSLGSGVTDVTGKVLVVTDHPSASLFTDNAVSSAWLIPNALPSFIAHLLYLLRLRRPAAEGKQNRELKTAYALIYGVLLPIGITTAVIVGMLGFSIALVVAPALSIVATSIALGRIIQKWKRAFDGSNPETLLKQKIKKAKLANEAHNTARKFQFLKQSMLLDYFLKDFRINDFPVDKANLAFVDTLNDYKEKKRNGENFNEGLLDKLINRYFQNDYAIFIDWLNLQRNLPENDRDKSFYLYDRLAQEKAMDQIIAQEDKLRWRTRFLIALGIMFLAALVLAVGAIVPFALPALILTFKIVGAVGGGVVFGAAATAGVMAGILNYRQYKSWVAENKNNPELIKDMRTAMGLQITGTALFIVSAALVGLSFIPFVNLVVIAAVGAAVIAAGLTLLGVGIYKAYQARKAASKLSAAKEKESESEPDQEIIHLHIKGYKPIPANMPAHKEKAKEAAEEAKKAAEEKATTAEDAFADEAAIVMSEAKDEIDHPLRVVPRMGHVLFSSRKKDSQDAAATTKPASGKKL